jgi:hypothetical protein
MHERGALVIGGLVVLLLVLPLGFVVHVSPRFPGSLAGSLIGITGGSLMLVPLAYLAIKRCRPLHDRVTRHVSMRTLLTLHIYAGILGPLLGLIHAAHKFDSPLGVSLTGMMLIVVASGYIGRYLLAQLARAVRGRRADLAALQGALERQGSDTSREVRLDDGGVLRGIASALAPGGKEQCEAPPVQRRLAEAIADLEFAIRAESVVQAAFEKWLKLHIVIAMVLYMLLALHIWAGVYYGLRWL